METVMNRNAHKLSIGIYERSTEMSHLSGIDGTNQSRSTRGCLCDAGTCNRDAKLMLARRQARQTARKQLIRHRP